MGCRCGSKSQNMPVRHGLTQSPRVNRPVIGPTLPQSTINNVITPFNPLNMNDDERRIAHLRREAIRRSLQR